MIDHLIAVTIDSTVVAIEPDLVVGGMAHLEQIVVADGATGFYERHGYTRIGTYPGSRFHLDWHSYRKEISG
ncbi:MAG: hypothetical protein DRH23_05810 [Deltaproteobacteria bacterium]|nr:MAG: hypothetical protein DRH23_05810 [Deltaproteobacteria bacterium]